MKAALLTLLLSGCVGNLALLKPGDEVFTAADIERLERQRTRIAAEMWRLMHALTPLCTETDWRGITHH